MDAIRERFSVRSYESGDIEEEKLERVLEAARLAPSARNLQEWRFVVVRDASAREALADAAKGQQFVSEAPAVIVACSVQSDYVMTCGLHAFAVDVSIAMAYMTLQAVEEGLGTCWIGAFHADRVKEVLGIPEEVTVVGMLPIGYPATEPPAKKRLDLAEIVMHERWRG